VDVAGKTCDKLRMSKLAMGIGAVAVIAAGAAIWVQHEDNAALRSEIALMREEVREAASAKRMVSALPGASAEREGQVNAERGGVGSAEFAKLREEIAGLKKNTQQVVEFVQLAQAAAAMKEMSAAGSGAPEKIIPANDLKNVGKATPEAAVQSVISAAIGADVDGLANGLVFTPAGRAKADAWFATLSDSTRQQYGSPEKIIALMVAKDAAGLSGMQVLGQKEISANDVGVRVRFANNDGQSKDDNLIMHRADDGWRLLLNDTVVQKFANKLGGVK
jgi:hypothetical protein